MSDQIPFPQAFLPTREHEKYRPTYIVEIFTKSGVLVLSTREFEVPVLGGGGGLPGAGEGGAGDVWGW
jgi:hypothetical protein